MNDLHGPVLTTERLRLRPPRESDFAGYAELCADPEGNRHLLRGLFTPEQSWRHLAFLVGHWHFRGYGMWVLEEKETRAFAGITGFANPAGWPGFELAWHLLSRFWGRGYATESARAALGHAFTVLREERVISLIQPENHASIRVAERLGESLLGRTQMVGKELLIYGIDRESHGGMTRPGLALGRDEPPGSRAIRPGSRATRSEGRPSAPEGRPIPPGGRTIRPETRMTLRPSEPPGPRAGRPGPRAD